MGSHLTKTHINKTYSKVCGGRGGGGVGEGLGRGGGGVVMTNVSNKACFPLELNMFMNKGIQDGLYNS